MHVEHANEMNLPVSIVKSRTVAQIVINEDFWSAIQLIGSPRHWETFILILLYGHALVYAEI